MNKKLLNVLQLTTVGMTLLFTSEHAMSDNNKHLCFHRSWGNNCGSVVVDIDGREPVKAGVLWTMQGSCGAIGAEKVSLRDAEALYDIFNRPECEFGK